VKRLFLAAFLALALHGLFLWISPAFFGKKELPKAQKHSVTISLTTRKVPVSASKPSAPAPVQPPMPTPETAPAGKKVEHENPPPMAEKIPFSDELDTQAVQEPPPPLPKAIPSPVTKVEPLQKKAVKPKKKPESTRKPVKAVQSPPPVPPETVKKSFETTPFVPEKQKTVPSPEKTMAKPDNETSPSQSPQSRDSRTPVADMPPSSSAPDGQDIRTTEPSYKNNPPPEYPRKARRRGYEGTVVLKVLVSEKGTVMEVRISEPSGHPVLDRAAEESVVKWTFEPGAMGAKKTEMWVNVPVRFDLKSP
jgi:protein TonB